MTGPERATDGERELQVIVVAYGEPQGLEQAITGLRGCYPVLVVDNSSSPAVEEVAARCGARYLDPGENLGFAAAVNRGMASIELAGCDVLLLNPDAVVEPPSVEVLRTRLHESPDTCCVAPSQHRPGSPKSAPVCWPFASATRAWAEAIGLGRFLHRWDYVIASVLLVRGEAVLDVGGFDEGFFLYAEEADWELRAIRRGWRVCYWEEACATHVGAATDPDPSRRALRFHAGVERFVRKWRGPASWRSYQAATVVTALRRSVLARGGGRGASLRLAQLYLRGPIRQALRTGALPEREHRIPSFGPATGGSGDAPATGITPARPVRVMLVDSIGYEELGGASTVLDEIIEHVDRTRFVPVLVCLSRGRWPEQVRARGTAAYSIPRMRLRSVRNLVEVVNGIRDVIRSQGTALVHASENTTLAYASIAGWLSRVPVVWHIHSPLQARSRRERLAARVLRLLRPAHIVFTSSGARERTMDFGRVETSVINPGTDLDRCRSGDAARGRRTLGIPEDAEVVSMFARVDPMKGQVDFVECVGRLAESHPRLFAVMCGPGDRKGGYWQRLYELSRRYGIVDRLLMPGDLRSPLKEDVLAASDVVVHPSHAESFGLAVLEAMAAGKPVVAAGTDGPRIMITDGETGMIVPVADPGALASAVGRLLGDQSLRQRIGSAAAVAAQSYPVEAMVRRFEDLWSAVLGSG
jgi:glycosyltransferase involved in cell wall biosynthesis/GT2 family glycosyltransferase